MSETALQLVSTDEAPLANPLRFSIPVEDMGEFALLPEARRFEVNFTLALLSKVASVNNFVAATNDLAVKYPHIRGMSGPSLRRKFYAYRDSQGDWRCLVKGYKAPKKLADAFGPYIKGLIEQNGRCISGALRQLHDCWERGEEVPGYGTWRDWFIATHPTLPLPKKFPGQYPQGWSTRNLRRYAPSRAERSYMTRGLTAAHAHLPKLKRDTSNLRPMEWIVLDDFELDVMSAFLGDPSRNIKPQIAYVAGLMAMCVGTRKHLAWMLGPQVERDERQPDGTVKKVRCGVRAIDVQGLLYKIFSEHGLPEYPVTLIVENAAAAIKPELELMLSTVFEGRIRVQRTSLIQHKTLPNGYLERGGTPWEKGWVESDFNYLWGSLAALPGYKGSNERLNAPGDHAEKLRQMKILFGQGSGKLNLPPEILEQLRLPFPSLDILEKTFAQVLARSEQRTNHKFNGFDAVTEFHWANPALPPPEGIDPAGPNDFRALAVLDQTQMQMMRPVGRKESSIERWERLSVQNARKPLSAGILALFLLTPKEVVLRNHSVTFTHNKTGYTYIDEKGDVLAGLEEGTKLLVYVDLQHPRTALVTTLQGAVRGTLAMLGGSARGVDVMDSEAMKAARAQRATVVNRVISEVRARPLHVAKNEQLAADRSHNEALIERYEAETAQLTTAQKIAAAVSDEAGREAEEQSTVKALRSARNESEQLLSGESASKEAGSSDELSSDQFL